MNQTELPAALHAFLFDSIEGYEHLELLILLHRDPARWWSVPEGARELRIPESLAERALEDLARQGLLGVRTQPQGAYRYSPTHPELDYKTQLLARYYQDQRFEIVKLMSANAIDRLRTATLRTFADAFLIGRAVTRPHSAEAESDTGGGNGDKDDDG